MALAATAALFAAAASPAAAPVEPKNGVYQGATGQTLPVVFTVKGRDSIDDLYFGSKFGSCESNTFAGLGDAGEPISRRGKFRIEVPFGDKWQTTLRGRFIDKTTARGRIVYTENVKNCGVASAKTRFRVTRSERL